MSVLRWKSPFSPFPHSLSFSCVSFTCSVFQYYSTLKWWNEIQEAHTHTHITNHIAHKITLRIFCTLSNGKTFHNMINKRLKCAEIFIVMEQRFYSLIHCYSLLLSFMLMKNKVILEKKEWIWCTEMSAKKIWIDFLKAFLKHNTVIAKYIENFFFLENRSENLTYYFYYKFL